MVGYQEVCYSDVAMRLKTPNEVVQYMCQLNCISAQLNHHHQGGDFVLEKFNKLIKSFTPQGDPSNDDKIVVVLWKR